MNRFKSKCTSALTLLVAAGAVQAQSLPTPQMASMSSRPTSYQAVGKIVTAGSNPNAALYKTPAGTGYEGIGALFLTKTNGTFICSTTLMLGGQYMLTAAHCLTNGSNTINTSSVLGVMWNSSGGREVLAADSWYVHPQYTGEVIDAHDVAVVHLSRSFSSSITAGARNIYRGNPFGQVGEAVGNGRSGTGATGATIGAGFNLSNRRRGNNLVDLSWTDPAFFGFFGGGGAGSGFYGNADPYGLVADFDNGLAANDASCLIGGAFGTSQFCNSGLGINEVSLGGGDSGGPLLIGGGVAGVASYGLTFGSSFGDIDNRLNDTFGEFSGWASTEYNQQWLDNYVAPEPASVVLTATGLLAVMGGAWRRRRRK